MEDEVLEQEQVVEEPTNSKMENVEESAVETPVAEPEPEPIQVYTKGKWEDLEVLTEKEMEVGKTYRIAVKGHCQFAVSAEKPTAGIATNEITFTKQDGLKLWIKTGE